MENLIPQKILKKRKDHQKRHLKDLVKEKQIMINKQVKVVKKKKKKK